MHSRQRLLNIVIIGGAVIDYASSYEGYDDQRSTVD